MTTPAEMQKPMTRQEGARKWYYAAIAIAFAIECSLWIATYLNGRAIDREIAQYESQANGAITPQFTKQQAVYWLEHHGFNVVYWEPNSPEGFSGYQSGPDGKFHLVFGNRRSAAAFMGKDRFVDLNFRWKLDGTFADVKGERGTFSFGSFRPPASQLTP